MKSNIVNTYNYVIYLILDFINFNMEDAYRLLHIYQ